jgi:D-glycero-D-manno-heptose 1,7-bisphosphate phosphatase
MSRATSAWQIDPISGPPASTAAFLDKDGTLMEDIPYNSDPQKFVFAPGVVKGLRHLSQAGFRLLVISNQSGVARGIFPKVALEPMEEKLRQMFESEGLKLDGVYWCPHHPEGNHPEWAVECDCRKPAPGMIKKAATDLNIHLASSWMIGDRDSDIGAAKNAGCRGALLTSSTQQCIEPRPDLVASTFFDIALGIVAQSQILTGHQNIKATQNG